jgi:hypothetical protein
MRSRSVAVAVAFTVACASGAIGCYLKAASFRSEAEWLRVRSTAEAEGYARSFNGALADRELATFEERRVLMLEKAGRWHMGQMLSVLASVVGLFSSYVLFLFAGLREQLIEGAPEVVQGPPAPHRT